MNSRKLFFSRLISNWHYQWKVLRSIADWTVIVYILVPLGVFCGVIYRSWWLEIPVWIHKIPFIVPFSAFTFWHGLAIFEPLLWKLIKYF
ncbi:ABC transporter permease [Niallia circulans]